MSNRLTFSLASLILILGLVFTTAPAMAVTTDVNIGIDGSINPNDTNNPNRFAIIRHDGATTSLTGEAAGTTTIPTDNTTALPDLDEAFILGTTIALLAPADHGLNNQDITADNPAVMAKDVVISEIMWGIDEGVLFAQQKTKQWIELYNTTPAATGSANGVTVDMSGWTLLFVDDYADIPVPAEKSIDPDDTGTLPAIKVKNVVNIDVDGAGTGTAADYVLVDIVSNDTAAGGGWVNDIGQKGNSTATTKVDLISMYRNIDYKKVTDATKKREEQLKDFPSGTAKGSWKASQRLFDTAMRGSPGKQHFAGQVTVLTASTVPYAPFVINEFYVDANNTDYNWIEIRNKDAEKKSLKNYHLSKVTAVDKDESLVNFHEKDIKIPGGGVLLIVATEPKGDKNHPIAAGINVETEEDANADDLEKNGLTSRYIVRDGITKLPKDKILLILRSAHDKTGKPEAFVDVTGTMTVVKGTADFATSLWPLKNTGAPHGDTIDGKGLDFKAGTVYKRALDGVGWAEHTWAVTGDQGPGYKREHQGDGTPGYDNGAVKVFDQKPKNADGKKNDKYMDASEYVSISEIMYQSEGNSPQWIELYNSSMTQSVQLNDWRLMLENGDGVPIRKTVTVKLNSKIIHPNQTVLIVAFNSNRNSRQFPSDRVIDIWKQGLKDKDKLEIADGTARTKFTFLSETAFKVTLSDAAGNEIDTVGNMGAEPAWDLPALSDEGMRASIIRRYNTGSATGTSVGRGSGEGMAQDGTMGVVGHLTTGEKGNAGWTVAMGQETYYGNQNDFGSPGFRSGGPLPVSLSKFRPERLKDTGDIVIRWITESELNNAGFNILRSETRNGQFIKINTQLIKGQGTTSERTTYEWKDTTAKPNVVYYYQIQDVSLDGQVQTLRMSRLKGNVTAAGKLTTTWGELKALQ